MKAAPVDKRKIAHHPGEVQEAIRFLMLHRIPDAFVGACRRLERDIFEAIEAEVPTLLSDQAILRAITLLWMFMQKPGIGWRPDHNSPVRFYNEVFLDFYRDSCPLMAPRPLTTAAVAA